MSNPLRQVLAALPGTVPEIAAATGLPQHQVRRHILTLRRDGYTIRGVMTSERTIFVLEGAPNQ